MGRLEAIPGLSRTGCVCPSRAVEGIRRRFECASNNLGDFESPPRLHIFEKRLPSKEPALAPSRS
jgi:hypothetical protein